MSQIWEYMKIAFMNIRNNKGRSVLTMLGIIIGIASVIMVISIGTGVRSEINSELDSFGGGMVDVYADSSQKDNTVTFDQSDFDYLQQKVKHVKGITPILNAYGSGEGSKGNSDANVTAGNLALQYYSSDPMVRGKYFTDEDVQSAAHVCVLNESSAIALFGTTDVVGMSFNLTLWNISQDMTIVGVRKNNASKLISMMNGSSTKLSLEMPISTLMSAYGYGNEDYNEFMLFADASQNASYVAKKAVSLLEARKGVRGDGKIQVQSFTDYTKQFDTILGYITIFVSFVAAISLLVGGIGVMNIMLVSVTERTREIGIRKSLGARTGSILLQFLAEAAIITLLGGIIGIAIGVTGAFAICGVIGFSAKVEASTVIIATIFSSAVGIFFGIYPAKKAAKLSPIEALRHE